MGQPLKIIVLDGDETGQELLEQSVRVLDSSLLGIELELEHYDLSLEKRRETGNEIVHEAARAMREAGFGLKAATVTPEGKDDVGSPNRILREEVDGKVIVRTGRRIPGVVGPVSGVHHPISVVRMAVEDAYGAKQWREGEEGADDEQAFRTEKVTRSTCRAVAEYAFRTAERMGGETRVYGGPKWTVSPVYEGMLKEEMDAAAERHPEVAYQPVLIDATYAGLLSGAADAPLVIPALNRDGDCLSDMVMPMFGSIAGAESILLAFDDDFAVDVAMAEAPHGTAPSLQGKDLANPMAMILACAAVLGQAAVKGHTGTERASRAIYEATLETTAGGVKTFDLGGKVIVLLVDALTKRIAGELCYLDGRARRLLCVLEDLRDSGLAVATGAKEGLLHQHHLLEELLAQPAFDHLGGDLGRLARGPGLLGVDRALALDERGVELLGRDGRGRRRGDVHGELAA